MTTDHPEAPCGPAAPDGQLTLAPYRALVFVDVETTGLDPFEHAIVEVAALKVDPATFGILDRFESRVRPPADAALDPAALRVNGYTPDAWAGAPPEAEVMPKLADVLRGSVVAGHNVAFDWAFVRAALRRTGVALVDVDHHLLDTASLAWPLLRRGRVPSLSLRALCDHFRVPNDGAHRALADVLRTVRLYRHLMAAR